MRQKHGDIVIVEGNNELNVQMTPIFVPPVAVYRCVYCPAAFSTEAGLVDHMESSHPGKPYLVYAYLSKDTVGFDYIKMDGWYKRDWITVYAKVFTPAIAADERYRFFFWFYRTLEYGYWPCSPCAVLSEGPAGGFYVGESSDLRPKYRTYLGPGGRVVEVPRGTYPLYSTCFFEKGEEYSVLWENVDTGLTITVV